MADRSRSVQFASVREFRSRLGSLIDGEDTVLVTRHGKPAAVFLPLEDLRTLPVELRRPLIRALGKIVSSRLEEKGITEEEVLNDFRAAKRRRRR